MKKTLSILLTGFVAALALQSCNQPKVDTAKEMAKIDSMASAKLMMYKDSMQMMCMNDVMAMAQARSDSMMQAAMKKGGKPKPKPVTAPAPKPTENSGKLGDKLNEDEGKKLKDKLNPEDQKQNSKLKDKLKAKPDTLKK